MVGRCREPRVVPLTAVRPTQDLTPVWWAPPVYALESRGTPAPKRSHTSWAHPRAYPLFNSNILWARSALAGTWLKKIGFGTCIA